MIPYKLYGRQGSGSFAVQVALEEIGVPYELIWVSGETADGAEFRRVSPNGKVPAMILPDGTAIFESAAILVHLATAHPDAAIAPLIGTTRFAQFLQWMIFLSANVYESALRIYYPQRYSTRGDADTAAVRDRGLRDFLQHIGVITQGLAPYVLGAQYSIADAYLYMLASWYPDGKTALFAEFPALRTLAGKLGQRPAVVKAEADHAT